MQQSQCIFLFCLDLSLYECTGKKFRILIFGTKHGAGLGPFCRCRCRCLEISFLLRMSESDAPLAVAASWLCGLMTGWPAGVRRQSSTEEDDDELSVESVSVMCASNEPVSQSVCPWVCVRSLKRWEKKSHRTLYHFSFVCGKYYPNMT